MTRKVFRVRKDTGKKEIVMTFGNRKNAEKISSRLDYKTFIEEVTLDDEGKEYNI